MSTENPNLPDGVAERSAYWNRYYGGSAHRPMVPSQFAAFVAGELSEPHRVVDVGCGTGRDALFFSHVGHRVVGIDGSESAIEVAQAEAAATGSTAEFICASITDADLPDRIALGEGPRVVYARFFVHALTEAEQASLLDLAAVVTRQGDILATEYRTIRDKSGSKVTGNHYRRFITPADFQAEVIGRGFEIDYAVEGFGHAKYGADDAYVAREIFIRR
jgi:SAM-dependent methyltransferase